MMRTLPLSTLAAALLAGAAAPAGAQDAAPFGVQYARDNAPKAHVAAAGTPWRVTSQNSEYDGERHYWTSYLRFKGTAGAKYKVTVASEAPHYAPVLGLSTCYSFTGERVDKSGFAPNQVSDPSPVRSVVLIPAASGDVLCSLSIDMAWAKNMAHAAAEAASPPAYSVTVVPQP